MHIAAGRCRCWSTAFTLTGMQKTACGNVVECTYGKGHAEDADRSLHDEHLVEDCA